MMLVVANTFNWPEMVLGAFLGASVGFGVTYYTDKWRKWQFCKKHLKPLIGKYAVSYKDGKQVENIDSVEIIGAEGNTIFTRGNSSIMSPSTGEIVFNEQLHGTGWYKHSKADRYGKYEVFIVSNDKLAVWRSYTEDPSNSQKDNCHFAVETSFIWKRVDSPESSETIAMDEKEKQQRYIKRMDAYEASSIENAEYAITRLDILSISLSTGGLYAIAEYHDFSQNVIDSKWIILPISCFASCIVINLVSQYFSYHENLLAARTAKLNRKSELSGLSNEEKTSLSKLSKSKGTYSSLTTGTNFLSYALLVLAIISYVVIAIYPLTKPL